MNWIFRAIADERRTVRQAARRLDEARTLERRWRPSEVHRVLTHGAYKLGPPGSRIVDPRLWNRAASVLAARRKR